MKKTIPKYDLERGDAGVLEGCEGKCINPPPQVTKENCMENTGFRRLLLYGGAVSFLLGLYLTGNGIVATNILEAWLGAVLILLSFFLVTVVVWN